MAEIYALPSMEPHVMITELDKLQLSHDKVRRRMFCELRDIRKELEQLKADVHSGFSHSGESEDRSTSSPRLSLISCSARSSIG